jgi:tetratricopeptide (TPR) repeat protein
LRPPLIPLGAACEAIRQAAFGLQNAHEFKLVHRDIKPANLMLDHRGTVKILDLGLGKFAEDRVEEQRADDHSSLTMAGMVLGTVDYISPEQCENSSEADIRSDLYSLGCSLYFLLTGKPVYSGSRYDTMRKKLMAHIVGEVPSLRQIIPELPKEIEAILQKVLAKEPAERFQTPIEFAEALAPFASPDELWTLVHEVVPTDAAESSSYSRHSNSPYALPSPSKQSIAPPVSRSKWISIFVLLNLFVFGLGIGAALYFTVPQFNPTARLDTMLEEAKQAEENALLLRKQWKMTEAEEEYRKATGAMRKMYDQTKNIDVLKTLLHNRVDLARTQWYHGDSRIASNSLETILNSIISLKLEDESKSELASIRMLVQEHRADCTLFGGAASGTVSERAFADRMSRYNEAAKIGAESPRCKMIRWKQAILYSVMGNVEEAEKLLKENPALPNETDVYPALVRQLAEAVLFYYQSEEGVERNRDLRIFQRQFSPQNNATPEMIAIPEILELLMFCQEFLLNDALKHEDWETLGESIPSTSQAAAVFLRQYPGAIPFMRRFHELLIRSAVLSYQNLEQSRGKQGQIRNIVKLLNQMRPGGDKDAVGLEMPTLIFFFLPENNKVEEGFVLFYPQDDREGTLYPLPLTRQKVKQTMPGGALPKLDTRLLEQVAAEKSAGHKIRVSWMDTAAWARADDALSESDYPYGDVLPLR